MKVIANTKSNFKNANGIPLEVVEIIGRRVSAKVPFYGFNEKCQSNGGNYVTADFSLDEVVEFVKK